VAFLARLAFVTDEYFLACLIEEARFKPAQLATSG
jgi:hypothetical protein